jgi:lyso-ornithine lipid O-acyltransferase
VSKRRYPTQKVLRSNSLSSLRTDVKQSTTTYQNDLLILYGHTGPRSGIQRKMYRAAMLDPGTALKMPHARLIFALCILIPTTLAGAFLQLFAITFRLHAVRRAIPVFWHRLAAWLLGMRVHSCGMPCPDRPLLIVANHISWLDIVAFSTLAPVSFIARADMRHWPLIGWLARLQGTVFVDRERRVATGRTKQEMAIRLNAGDALVLFAEGTSTDGSRVLPFRPALLGAASLGTWVQPVAITYTNWQGVPTGRRERPFTGWYGGMDLLPHLSFLLEHGCIDAHIVWGEPVLANKNTCRKQLAFTLRADIRAMRQVTQAESHQRPNGSSCR